jgi:hypothetical protein
LEDCRELREKALIIRCGRVLLGSLPIGDLTDWRFQLAFADQVAVESYANGPIKLPNAFAAFGAYGSGRLLGIAPEGQLR